MRFPRRRPLRLAPAVYATPGTVASTNTSTLSRRRFFSDAQLAAIAVDVIKERAEHHKVPVYAYCVMPDHVHLVVGPSSSCDVVKFLGQFKSLTVRAAWNVGVTGTLWQRSFFDHILRQSESLAERARYVLQNPVRAGLVAHWSKYPYSGCLALRTEDVMQGCAPPSE